MDELFEKGKTYKFEVLELRPNSYGNIYIFLRYGNKDTYRVKAYPFQVEEPERLPKEMLCLVVGIDVMTGLPTLRQERGSLLKTLFDPGEEYPFKLHEIITDDNTSKAYYQLTDSFGLEHRFYFSDKALHEKHDIFSLKVNSIDERKGILLLGEPMVQMEGTPSPIVTKDFGPEDLHTEFKSSIVFVPGNNIADIDKQLNKIIRTIAGFLNSDGGTLWIGVNDSGSITGIEPDFEHLNSGDDDYNGTYKYTPDSYELKIRNALIRGCGNIAGTKANFTFYTNPFGKLYCGIDISKSPSPIFFNGIQLFQRAGNQIIQLKGDEITNFIRERLSAELKGIIGEHLEKSFKALPASTPVPGNIEVKVPMVFKPQIPSAADEVWNYFTFYKDGKWSFQKDAVNNDTVECEMSILKSQKDFYFLICYDNGYINSTVPTQVRSKKDRGKPYANGWNIEAKILKLFISAPFNLIAAYSIDNEETSRVKAHIITDFNPVATLKSKGSMIVNPSLGKVTDFKLVGIENKNAIPSLLMEKRFTSQSLGYRLTDPIYKDEIEFLNRLS